jgi:hypothetical protein
MKISIRKLPEVSSASSSMIFQIGMSAALVASSGMAKVPR